MFLSPSARLSHGWRLRGSGVHMLLWLEPPFICGGKRWKHLHKLAIWRFENSIPSSWFEHLGKTCLKHKDWEAFGPLMSITSEDVIDLCGLGRYKQHGGGLSAVSPLWWPARTIKRVLHGLVMRLKVKTNLLAGTGKTGEEQRSRRVTVRNLLVTYGRCRWGHIINVVVMEALPGASRVLPVQQDPRGHVAFQRQTRTLRYRGAPTSVGQTHLQVRQVLS